MASNGLLQRAKKGTCRICQRVRKTDDRVRAVGEVRRGYATGHIWECIDKDDCKKTAQKKLNDPKVAGLTRARIETSLIVGHYYEYIIVT